MVKWLSGLACTYAKTLIHAHETHIVYKNNNNNNDNKNWLKHFNFIHVKKSHCNQLTDRSMEAGGNKCMCVFCRSPLKIHDMIPIIWHHTKCGTVKTKCVHLWHTHTDGETRWSIKLSSIATTTMMVAVSVVIRISKWVLLHIWTIFFSLALTTPCC